jgi:hypothetical protein
MSFTNYGDMSIGRITAGSPAASLVPLQGPPGQSVVVNGGGFAAGEMVTVKYKTGLVSPSSVALCPATAAPDGTFSCTGSIPTGANSGVAGAHKIQTKGKTSGLTVTVVFQITW